MVPSLSSQSAMRARALFALALLVLSGAACSTTTGSIRGQIRFANQPGDRPATGTRSSRTTFSTAVVMAWPVDASPRTFEDEHAIMVQSQHKFRPSVVTIPVGGTVWFENRDRVYHNVFSVSPENRFDIGKYAPGKRRSVRFDRPGFVEVFCDVHPNESAFVVVSASRWVTRPRTDGGFALSNIPPSTYTIHAWHPVLGERTQQVQVSKEAPANVQLTF